MSTLVSVGAAPTYALDPVNPVTVDVGGHPANSGFLVFVEDDVTIRADESEGTIAMGGDFHIQSNYNVAAGSTPVRPTFTAPGDSGQTYLYVGGGVSWEEPGAGVNVELQGFTKVADTTTYSAYNQDSNGAQVNYRLVPSGEPYESTPRIEGRTHDQTPASIGTPVPTSLIDIPSAFDRYRELTAEMGACPQTVELEDGRLTLEPGMTNVLELSAAELDALPEITFTNQPTASMPLLVNVTGDFTGTLPNLAGVSGAQAPYMMWNFPDASTVTVTGGDSIEGTLYAPNAELTWRPSSNIEGNVIAARFNHGQPAGLGDIVREVHDFPFSTTLSCAAVEEPAHLTLVKRVVNDDGGTAEPGDWTLSGDGPTPIEGETGSDAVTDAEVDPGDYALDESGGPDGYDASDWVCDGGSLTGDVVTVAAGDDVTCTITNDDNPDASPSPSPSPTDTPTASPSGSTSGSTSPSPSIAPSGTGAGPGGGGVLPDTGSPLSPWLLALGLALLCGGAGLVLLARRTNGAHT